MTFESLQDFIRRWREMQDIAPGSKTAEDDLLSLLKVVLESDAEAAEVALHEIEGRLKKVPAYPTRLRAGYSWKPLPSVAKAALQRFPDRLGLAALLSISSDGYVRELAVKHLAALSGGRGLPYLVTRSSDWIYAVSKAAESALPPLFSQASDRDVVLAVHAAYAASKRERHVGWVLSAEVAEMLKRPHAIKMSSSLPAPVIRWISKRLERDGINPESWALSCPDPVVRSKALSRKMAGAQTPEDRAELLQRLLGDAAPGIRLLAFGPFARDWTIDKEIYERALLDSNRAVRQSAQLLEPQVRNPRGFYYANLDKPNSIRGLSDFHQKKDLPAFRQALKSEQAVVRKAALDAIGAVDDRVSIPDAIPMLEDIATAKSALDALIQLRATLDPDKLVRIAANSARHLQVRKTAVRALRLVSRWDQVISLLNLMPFEELRPLVIERLVVWNDWFKRRPTPPEPKYRDAFSLSMENAKP